MSPRPIRTVAAATLVATAHATTILADGRRLIGAVPRAQLERELQRTAKP